MTTATRNGSGDLRAAGHERSPVRPVAEPGIVVYRAEQGIDAIDEYSRRLVTALHAAGTDASYVATGLREVRELPTPPPWILLQYNPFGYGRWGFAPGLVRDALLLRRRASIPLAIMVHEAWVDMIGWRLTLMGAYQRLQLRLLLALADVAMTSTAAIAEELGPRAVHVPIGSNIRPVATTPDAARAELGLADRLVVTLFGRGNPSRALSYAEAAIAELVTARGNERLTVLNLGADAPALNVPSGVDVRSPSALTDRELSLRLWASDLVLLPFTDGLSTRRTTMMAALAHGRAVLGLRGSSTDRVLIEHPEAIEMVPADDKAAFSRAAVALCHNTDRRAALGAAGRRLYLDQFDWPVVARRVTTVLGRLPLRGTAVKSR